MAQIVPVMLCFFAMGYASDAVGAQWGAIAVMTIGVVYLLLFNFKIRKN